MRTIPQGDDGLPTPAERARILDLSDERAAWSARCLEFWRAGYAAAEHEHADDYEAGFHDGAMARKRAEHERYEAVRQHLGPAWFELQHDARWGPGGRGHFADPRPGDYAGREAS